MIFKRKGKQGRRGSHQAVSRCWGPEGKASRHQQVKKPEGGQQQVETTAGVNNAWATGTHFSLKCHIFGIVTSSREPVLTELLFLVASLFHLPRCRLQRVQLKSPVLLCSEMEDASNQCLWGTKYLAPLSTLPGEAGYRSKRDRASEVQTTDWDAVCTKTLTHTAISGSFKVRRRTSCGMRIIDILGACKEDATWLVVAANWSFIATNLL